MTHSGSTTEGRREPATPAVRADNGDADIEIRNLRHGYVNKQRQVVEALTDINVTIHKNEFICLVGPSGCGKTSLLRIIAGLNHGYQGTVSFGGRAESAHGKKDRLPVTVVFQQDSTLPWLRVESNVMIGMSGLTIGKAEARERANHYLRLVGLQSFARAYPHELSGGMRQRVAIARALAPEPLLLLMDEPLAALDAQTRLIMQGEILDIVRRTESTVLYITHDVEEALTLGDRVLAMSRRPGRIKSEITTPWRQYGGKGAMDILTYRSRPEVIEQVEHLSRLLREEVGERL